MNDSVTIVTFNIKSLLVDSVARLEELLVETWTSKRCHDLIKLSLRINFKIEGSPSLGGAGSGFRRVGEHLIGMM